MRGGVEHNNNNKFRERGEMDGFKEREGGKIDIFKERERGEMDRFKTYLRRSP